MKNNLSLPPTMERILRFSILKYGLTFLLLSSIYNLQASSITIEGSCFNAPVSTMETGMQNMRPSYTGSAMINGNPETYSIFWNSNLSSWRFRISGVTEFINNTDTSLPPDASPGNLNGWAAGNNTSGNCSTIPTITVCPASVMFIAPADVCVDAAQLTNQALGTPAVGTVSGDEGVYSGTGVADDGNGMTYSFSPNTAGVGTHTIRYTYTDGNGCTAFAEDDIEVLALPVVTFTAPADLCIDGVVQPLTGTPAQGPVNGDIGEFSGVGVIDNQDGTYDFDPSIAEAGPHTITYTYTDGNGCEASGTDNIEVFALPTVTLEDFEGVCVDAGMQIGLDGGMPVGGTYSGIGVTDNVDGTFDFDPAAQGAGSVTYTYTDANSCTNSDDGLIEVFALPTPTFLALADLCINAGVQAGLSGGMPAQVMGTMGSYSGPGVTDNNGTYDFDPSDAGDGTHTLEYEYTDENGCTNIVTDEVVVFALPNVTLLDFPGVCVDAMPQTLGGGMPIGGVYSGPGVTDAGDGSTFSFDPNLTATMSTAGTGVGPHSITYTFTDVNGCTNSDAVLIKVFALPGVTFEAPDYCADQSAQVLVEGTPGPGEYSGPEVTNNGDGTYSFDPMANGVGDYTVTYTFTDVNGCSASVMDNIEVFALPTVTLVDPGDFCLNDGVQMGLTGGMPAEGTVTGDIGVYSGTGVIDLGNGTTYNFNPMTAGVGGNDITYTYTDENGCTASNSVQIEVFDLPPVTFTAPAGPFCDNDGVQTSLTGGMPTGGEYSGSGVSGPDMNGVYTFDPSVAGDGIHTITYSFTDGNGCSVTASDDVEVDEAPEAMLTLTSPDEFCVNDGSVTLSGGMPTGGVYSGMGVTGPAPGTDDYTFDPGIAGVGMHTITYASTENGCTDEATAMVEVFSAPGVTFIAPGPFCDNAGVQTGLSGGMISASNDFGIYTGTGVTDKEDGTFDFDPAALGAGSVTYTFSDVNGCEASATGTIMINAAPMVMFTAPDDLCIDEGKQPLTGSPSGGTYMGTGVIDNMNGTYDFDPSMAGDGVHTITYTFTDANTCVVSTMDDVEVFDPMVAFSALAPVCSNAGDQTLGGGTPTTAGTGIYSGNGVTDVGDGLTFTFDPDDANVVTGANPITYTYIDANGCLGTANSDITVNAAPVVTFPNPGPFCSNDGPQDLTGATPVEMEMGDEGVYEGPGVTLDAMSGIYSFDPATVAIGSGPFAITYTYTDANGCSDEEIIMVVVNAAPEVMFTNPGPQCSNDGLLILTGGFPAQGAASGDMGEYVGTGVSGPDMNGAYTFDPTMATVGMNDINYTYTDENGCSDEETIMVVVNAAPVVTFMAPGPQCSNGAAQMFSGGTPQQGTAVDDMGLYSGDGVTDDGNGITYTFNPAMVNTTSSEIFYTYTDENGCAVTESGMVDINTAPTVMLTLPSDYCIDAGPQNLSGGSPVNGEYSGSGVTDNMDGTYTFNPAEGADTYTITYTFTDANGCTNSAMDDVEVFALPGVTFEALEDLCVDATAQTGLSGGMPTQVTGTTMGSYFGPGVNDNGNGTYNFDPSMAGAGNHTITYTYKDANGCTNTATDNVDVFALPVLVFEAPADLCIDGGLQPLTGSPSQGTVNGDVGVFSGDGVIANQNGTYDFDPSVAGAGPHTIMYTYTDGNGCTNVAMDDVEVFAPVVALTTPAPICENAGVVTLGGGTPTGGVYSGTGVTDNTNGLSYDFDSSLGAGMFMVTYKFTDTNGCMAEDKVDIVVNTAPDVMFTAPVDDVCFDDVVLAMQGGGTPTGGVYSGTGVTDDGNGMTYSFDPMVAGAGPITITYTYTNENGCTDSAEDDITVNPENTVSAPSSTPTLCINTPLTDITHTTTDATGIVPSMDPNLALPDGVTASFSNDIITISGTPTEAGIFTYVIELTGGCGMVSATGTITVDADMVPPTITCPAAVAVNNDPGTCGADALNVMLGSPTVSDNCNMNIIATNDAPDIFLVGITMVTWTADDGNGSTPATCQQMVTVIDNEGPTPDETELLDVEAQCMVSSLTAPTATDNCMANTVTVSNDAPANFPFGTTTVTWTYDDGLGNTSTQTQNVIVEDTVAPVVTAPADITVEINNGCMADNIVLGSAMVTDNCNMSPAVTNDAPATFPVGPTVVTWTADDDNTGNGMGNTGSDVQTITVIASDINLQGNGTDIASGDMTPDTADDTDFGSILVGDMTTRTFTIQNIGDATLDLTGNPIVAISGSSNFSVTTQPSATTIVSGDLTFEVTYSSSAVGTDVATISIESNDCDTPTYTFDITGQTDVACDIAITSITTTDEICPGADDGTLTVIATCSTCTGGIEYSIDGFTTFNTNGEFTNLADGTYPVSVRDAGNNSCNVMDQSSVINPGVVVLFVPTTPNGAALFKASEIVNSDATVELGQGNTDIIFEAGDCINLLPGFEVELGARFEANIVECPE